MPLTLNSTYQNVFYDFVLDSIRDTLITEFNYAKIYIAPEKIHDNSLSIKLWGTNHRLDNYSAGEWVKEYDVDITLYAKLENNEQSYRQFYQDQERVFQCIYNNYKGATAKTVESTTIHLTNGTISEIEVLTPDETDVENLFQANFLFTVLANRSD